MPGSIVTTWPGSSGRSIRRRGNSASFCSRPSRTSPASRTPRPTMCPTPWGKKSDCAPRSTSDSGSPRSSPNSTKPSAITRAADVVERVPQLRLEPSVRRDVRHRGAEAGDTPTRPLLQPRTQLGDGYAFLAVLRPRPEELVAGHGRDEVDPADLRIEGEDTAG